MVRGYKNDGSDKHMFTKKDILAVVDLWEKKGTQEIADEMGLTKNQIVYLAVQIRNSGYKLPKKKKNGYIQSLVKEALKERNLI